ncbi:MAG: hypothetical protein LBI27_03670 [Clostridiales bacterium]|nr:hypothetical protein [Clostridiales bacterium]
MKKFFAILFFTFIFATTAYASESIPNNGGRIQVDGRTTYSFTPDRSGYWVFQTSENGDSDPNLELRSSDGRIIAEDDDGGGDYNSLIMLQLEQGRTYTLVAGFYSGNRGRYILDVTPLTVMNATSDTMQVNGEMSFLFTPAETGLWSFETSNNGGNDPMLWLYDMAGQMVNLDDDSGNGLNANLRARVNAGTEYLIRVGYYNYTGDEGSCTLNIAQIPVTEISGEGEYTVKSDNYFSFIPNETGFWTFSTGFNRSYDPHLWLYDDFGIIAEDDDGNGDLNSRLIIPLEAGQLYYLHAGFYTGENGKYALNVEITPMPAPIVANPANLFEANQHRADRPAWMTDVRFQNHNRSFEGANGVWEAAVRELFADKQVTSGDYSQTHLFRSPVTHDFSFRTRESLRIAAAAESYFNQLPYNHDYISEIIFDYLGFNFTAGESGGMYIGRERFSTITLDISRRGDWAVAVLGHEFAHALSFGESLSDFVEEGLMDWEYSTQGEGAREVNPLGIQNAHGLMYNSSFDRTLERLAGQEEFWFYASFSDHAYGEFWNSYLREVVSFREMQVLRSLMRACDNSPTLAYHFEEFVNMPFEDFQEEILRDWRTVFVEAHPSNNFAQTPPTASQQHDALINLENNFALVGSFARQFNIAPYTAVLPDIQNNHQLRLQSQ